MWKLLNYLIAEILWIVLYINAESTEKFKIIFKKFKSPQNQLNTNSIVELFTIA